MKTRRMICLVLLLGGLLSSCGLPSAPPPPESSPPPQFAVSPDAPTELDELILYEIEHKRTEELLARISPSSLEHYGEPVLRERISRMNDLLHGTVIRWQAETTGYSSYRGRGGRRSTSYLMKLFTQQEIWYLSYEVCTEDTSGPDHRNDRRSLGLTKLVLHASSRWQEMGRLSYEEYQARAEGFQIWEPDQYAREVRYPGKGYTGYSVAYLQAISPTFGTSEACALAMMEALETSCGFVGDITWGEGAGIGNLLAEQGATECVEDEKGTRFYLDVNYDFSLLQGTVREETGDILCRIEQEIPYAARSDENEREPGQPAKEG